MNTQTISPCIRVRERACTRGEEEGRGEELLALHNNNTGAREPAERRENAAEGGRRLREREETETDSHFFCSSLFPVSVSCPRCVFFLNFICFLSLRSHGVPAPSRCPPAAFPLLSYILTSCLLRCPFTVHVPLREFPTPPAAFYFGGHSIAHPLVTHLPHICLVERRCRCRRGSGVRTSLLTRASGVP